MIYVSLKLCGFAYKIFEHILGSEQYFPPGSAHIPISRMFAQFHAAQTSQMKDEILKQLCLWGRNVQVIFATVTLCMGVDISDICEVIHVSPPCLIKAYFQETGRAGRDSKSSMTTLYYNNRNNAGWYAQLVFEQWHIREKIAFAVFWLYTGCCWAI